MPTVLLSAARLADVDVGAPWLEEGAELHLETGRVRLPPHVRRAFASTLGKPVSSPGKAPKPVRAPRAT